jgi:hypothetical protein
MSYTMNHTNESYSVDAAETDIDRLKLCILGLSGVIDSIILVDEWDTAAEAIEYAESNDIALEWASDYVARLTTILNRARLIEQS